MEKRSRITIFAIILATFAAGALVWFLAQPTDEETPDVAREAQEQLAQQNQNQNDQQIPSTTQPTPDQNPTIATEQRPTPVPKIASAVSTSAQTGPAETTFALLLIATAGGALGLRKLSAI